MARSDEARVYSRRPYLHACSFYERCLGSVTISSLFFVALALAWPDGDLERAVSVPNRSASACGATSRSSSRTSRRADAGSVAPYRAGARVI